MLRAMVVELAADADQLADLVAGLAILFR